MTAIPITKFPPKPEAEVPAGWMQHANGRGIDLLNPRVEDVDWNNIATSLSLLCRYTGHMKSLDDFYSVAQHSVLVADLLHPSVAIYGLLHDAHEAFFGDDATPKKRALASAYPEAADWLDECKAAWDAVIWQAAGVPAPDRAIQRAVHDADYMALSIEHKCLQNPAADATTRAAWRDLPDASAWKIVAVPPREAHGLFLARLNDCLWPSAQEGVA
jgi:hypothetical protein